MNKKLTTILLAVLIILIGKVDAATLTQKIGEGYIRSTVVEGQEVTIKFVSSKYTFSNWTVESGNITIDTTNPVVTFTMPSSNVVIRANFVGATESNTTLSSVVSVGDYITYVPSSTSYTVPTTVSGYDSDQNYNPSSTTSWRVFSNDGTNVEIISADSVGDLVLGGDTGYVNAVQTLQDMSAAYVNSTYATTGRSLGYSESELTTTQIANYKTIDTATYPFEYGISSTFPYSEPQYTADETVLSNHGSMYHSSGYVWLATRSAYTYPYTSDSAFTVGLMNTSGDYYGGELYYVFSDSVNTNTNTNGVRPIVTLKSGLTIKGGSGTSSDPYIITDTSTSQYTITYCANGGYGDMNPQSVSQGNSITLTTNAYEHHSKTFAGWATSATGSVVYTDGANVTPTADMTLYAVWQEEITGYTLTYDGNCPYYTYTVSNVPSAVTQESTTFAISSTYPTISENRYRFLGWSTSSSATVEEYWYGKEITISQDTTLYAVWESNVLGITYYATTEENYTEYDEWVLGDDEESHTFTIQGISGRVDTEEFVGWIENSYKTSPDYITGDSVTLNRGGSISVWALWKCKCCGDLRYNASDWPDSEECVAEYCSSCGKCETHCECI